jgi:predicted nucleic acid-binding protein
MPRTMVASMRTAAAVPTPRIFRSISGSVVKMENTATMMSAALVTTPALDATPPTIACFGDEPRAHSSRTRLRDVLLDVITGDEQWADWSAREIAAAMDAGRVVINPLIYAEVSVGYQIVEELEELLPATDYERESLPYLAGFAAGKAFVRYRRGGGEKRSPMPDFYIGAHAAITGYRLMTRDVRRYRTDFPTIDLIAPSTSGDETD